MSNETMIEALGPVLAHLKTLDLSDPEAARESLNQAFPPDGPTFAALGTLAQQGVQQGWLCTREGGPSKFSRVAKSDKGNGFSIDAVLLWGEGPRHKHLKGEINCMFALEGEPKFCGFEPGWAVFAPGSAHVPSVQGGKMLILYMLPDGAVEW